MSDSQDRFPALQSRDVSDFLDERATLATLARSIGTPFHVVFPEQIAENIGEFRNVLQEEGLPGDVFFAAKANKSDSALEVAASLNAGVDVSSLYEQRAALGHGVVGRRIRLSGPMKDPRSLALALQQEASIAVDSPEELAEILAIRERLASAVAPRVLLRSSEVAPRPSRFGMNRAQLDEAYRLLSESGIPLEGYTFHLDGYSLEERGLASFALLEEADCAKTQGFTPRVLDIGGGFGVSYIDRAAWERFQEHARDSRHFFRGRTFSSYYPYFCETPGPEGLRRVLNLEQGGQRLADAVKRRSMELHLEPGRSLLDQSGITVFGVLGTKQASNGEWLVQVDGNMNHLSEQWFNTDFVPDPVLITRDATVPRDFHASVAGNTCMESDMVTWRKVHFGAVPQRGDLLVYLNTAGYMMDSNETDFHRLPVPEKIAAFRDAHGQWQWKRDSLFSHLDLNP